MSALVLLGFGGNVDVEVTWDADVLTQLATEYRITQDELNLDVPVTDERTLTISILSFMRAGTGGERFVAAPEVLMEGAERFDHRWTLGGSSIRAALTMHAMGMPSMVHLVSTNEVMRTLLPERISRLNSATEDTMHPHLIVQYPKGARIQTPTLDVVADRSNRLIYVNDPPNQELALSGELDEIASDIEVLLVSGLNSMQDHEALEDRLQSILRVIAKMGEDSLVLFEDAGQHVPELGARVQEVMAQHAAIFSMNEDELFGHIGRSVDLLDSIAVEHAIREAHRKLGVRNLLVHTQHWAAIVGPSAAAHRRALQGGIDAAGTRYLMGDHASHDDFLRIVSFPVQRDGARVATELEARFAGDAVCLPAYELHAESATTIGLGDSFLGGLIAVLATKRQGETKGVPQ